MTIASQDCEQRLHGPNRRVESINGGEIKLAAFGKKY